jgi:hypothetical protein
MLPPVGAHLYRRGPARRAAQLVAFAPECNANQLTLYSTRLSRLKRAGNMAAREFHQGSPAKFWPFRPIVAAAAIPIILALLIAAVVLADRL